MTLHIPSALVLVITLFPGGEGEEKAVKALDPGTLTKNVYTNEYFGLKITLPEKWHILSRARIVEVEDVGRELIVGDDKALDQQLQEAKKNTHTLFWVSQHSPDAVVKSNPSISCAAEKVSHVPQVKTGADYLQIAKGLLQKSAVPYKFPDPTFEETISGTKFHVLPAQINLGQQQLKQKMYAACKKDYVLLLVLTFTNEKEEAELMKSLSAMKLD